MYRSIFYCRVTLIMLCIKRNIYLILSFHEYCLFCLLRNDSILFFALGSHSTTNKICMKWAIFQNEKRYTCARYQWVPRKEGGSGKITEIGLDKYTLQLWYRPEKVSGPLDFNQMSINQLGVVSPFSLTSYDGVHTLLPTFILVENSQVIGMIWSLLLQY